MRKPCFSFLLAFVILFSLCGNVSAHGKEKHDPILSSILFGNPNYKKNLDTKSSKYTSLEALENAVALCLDQFNGNYTNELSALQKMKIHGIPNTIDEIDFNGNSHHRRFTHQGWNNKYIIDKGHWETRKTLLLQTVNKVFGFQNRAGKWKILWIDKDYGYSEQCDAFAELIYYIHILADIEESGMDEGYSDMIKLALAHPQTDSPDIYMELLRILPILFESQKTNSSYTGLITDIKLQAKNARSFIADTPDLKSNYSEYQDYAKSLLKKLEAKIPDLLAGEEFFAKVFPAETK